MVHTQPLYLGAGLQACGGSASVYTDPCSSGRQGGSWIQLSASRHQGLEAAVAGCLQPQWGTERVIA
jgi:hypothetical protein